MRCGADFPHDKTHAFMSLFEFGRSPYYCGILVKKYQARMYTRGV